MLLRALGSKTYKPLDCCKLLVRMIRRRDALNLRREDHGTWKQDQTVLLYCHGNPKRDD